MAVQSQSGLISKIMTWTAKPYTEDMDVGHWALFTGLIVILAIMWIFIARKLAQEVM